MQKNVPLEFIYQVFSLIIAVIIIHAIYVSIIRPGAREVLEQQAIEINSNPNYVPERIHIRCYTRLRAGSMFCPDGLGILTHGL